MASPTVRRGCSAQIACDAEDVPDPNAAEFTAARVVAVFVLERFIRARTALVLWGFAAIAIVLWIGTVASHGIGAVFVGLFALVATTIAVTLFAARALVLRAIRRVGGGRHYARLRPVVARRVADVERAHSVIPLDGVGPLRLAWMARRPRLLAEQVREAAATVATTIPEVVADVRRELGPSSIVDI